MGWKATHKHIINLFETNMRNLCERLSVSKHVSVSHSLFILSVYRATTQVLLAWHVMHGRVVILMPILLLQVTGMRQDLMASGVVKMPFSGLHKWTAHMTVLCLDRCCTQLLSVWILATRYTWLVACFNLRNQAWTNHLYSQVGWIMCDNVSNNLSMLKYFDRILNASKMREKCAKKWNWVEYHIRYVQLPMFNIYALIFTLQMPGAYY